MLRNILQYILIVLIGIFIVLTCSCSTRKGSGSSSNIEIQMVPEMEHIPSIQPIETLSETLYQKESKRCHVLWYGEYEYAEKHITPEKVQSLSRWAQEQMKGYRSVPSLSNVTFKLIGKSSRENALVFENTLDTLPSHHPLVTRWLKIFLLYNKERNRITQIIVTIRGERLE